MARKTEKGRKKRPIVPAFIYVHPAVWVKKNFFVICGLFLHTSVAILVCSLFTYAVLCILIVNIQPSLPTTFAVAASVIR